MPTATIRLAPFSSAISSATSSLVPAAGQSDRVEPQRLDPGQAGRTAVRVGVHDDLGTALPAPWSDTESMSPTIRSGR